MALAWELAKANFKLRNEGTYLGILWYLIEPLALFFIFLKINSVLRINIEYYPLYLLLGLMMFNLFSKSTSMATTIMPSNKGLLKSLKIKKESFVIGSFIQNIFSHSIELILFTALLTYYGLNPIRILYYIPFILTYGSFILGISFFLSIIGVYIKDLDNVWKVFTTVLWIATPIFYVIYDIGLNNLNPLFHFFTVSRNLIIYDKFPSIESSLIIISLSLISLTIGLITFQKFKNSIVERL